MLLLQVGGVQSGSASSLLPAALLPCAAGLTGFDLVAFGAYRYAFVGVDGIASLDALLCDGGEVVCFVGVADAAWVLELAGVAGSVEDCASGSPPCTC